MKTNFKLIDVNDKTYKLSLDYIFGLFEGDGSITIQLKPNKSHKAGKQIILIFEIHQHVIDIDLLKAISIYLGCGKVEIGRKVGAPDTWVYRLRISTQKDILEILLPILLDQSSKMMLTKRKHDIKLFISACLLVKDKKHTTIEGQEEIANIASKLSSKLTFEDKLKLNTSAITVAEPQLNKTAFCEATDTEYTLSTERVTGFVDAEGHFSCSVKFIYDESNPGTEKIPKVVSSFSFLVVQESSEINSLNSLIKFWGCGKTYTRISRPKESLYSVSNRKDLVEKIVPFFEENKLQTIKQHSFLRFKKVLNICMKKNPLTKQDINELNSTLKDVTGKRPVK